LEPTEAAPVVVRQVHDMHRLGEIEPFMLPCGVTTVDGKSYGRIGHDANGAGLRQHDEDGTPWWHVRVLRAVLSSAVCVPCLGQHLVPADAGEVDTFPRFADWLHENYGRHALFDILDVDAGFASRSNWDHVDQKLQYGLIMRLKANQKDLHTVAQQELDALAAGSRPEAVTDWERYQGKEIRRSLYRTDKLDGYAGWQHLRQAWLVVVETREETSKLTRKQRRELGIERREFTTTIEHRYYVSNLCWNRLTPAQILLSRAQPLGGGERLLPLDGRAVGRGPAGVVQHRQRLAGARDAAHPGLQPRQRAAQAARGGEAGHRHLPAGAAGLAGHLDEPAGGAAAAVGA
jgi:hypothetical protein